MENVKTERLKTFFGLLQEVFRSYPAEWRVTTTESNKDERKDGWGFAPAILNLFERKFLKFLNDELSVFILREINKNSH